MEKNKISAIIPTHGAGDAFIECVESLLTQTVPLTQIIIINNNVRDGSIEQLQSKYALSKNGGAIHSVDISIYSLSENTGVTGGRNEGIRNLPSEYDYALFVDHDMVAEPTMLQELLTVANKQQQIGIVTPKIYYWQNKNIVWSAGTDINLKNGQTLFHGGEDRGQFAEDKEVGVAPAILLVKKAVLEDVSQFDTTYFATYEDTDFCFAARKKNWQTWYAAKAIAYHKIPYDPNTAMQRLLERTYYVARNRIIFMRRYSPFFLQFLLYLPVYLLYYIFLALRYHNANAIRNYIRGTIHGLFHT